MIWQKSRQWQNQVLNTSVILLKFLLLLVSPLSPLHPHSHQHTSVGAVSPPWTCLHFPEFGINGAHSVCTLLWMACCTMISLRLTHLVPRALSSLLLLLIIWLSHCLFSPSLVEDLRVVSIFSNDKEHGYEHSHKKCLHKELLSSCSGR